MDHALAQPTADELLHFFNQSPDLLCIAGFDGIFQRLNHRHSAPPKPPFDIETMKPIEPPWQTIKEWIPDDEPDLDWFN